MAALVKTELDPESFANGEGHTIAQQLAQTVELTSLKEGEKYKQKLNEILERAERHPIVAFELFKLEEQLKIELIQCGLYERFKTKYQSNREVWEKMGEDETVGKECIGLLQDELFEARRLKTIIDRIHANPGLIPPEWMAPLPDGIRLATMGECNGETESPITYDDLKEGKIVKLTTDGICYTFNDLVHFYNHHRGVGMRSPITRTDLNATDIEFMRILTSRRRPLGFNGSWAGGKKKSKKSKKSKSKKNKKTRRN
jgi:hypothetical protein